MENLQEMSTFDIAFKMATGKFNEEQKFEALSIIRERDKSNLTASSFQSKNRIATPSVDRKPKTHLKGSKSEKIAKLAVEGRSAREIKEMLESKKIKVYYPEIYRIMRGI